MYIILNKILWLPFDILVSVTIFSIILFIGAPLLIYRCAVIQYVKIRYPSYIKAGWMEQHFSYDLFYKQHLNSRSEFSSGIFTIVFGNVSLVALKEHWKKTVIDARNTNGSFKYPLLSSVPVLIGGYIFYRGIPNFKLDNIYEVKLKSDESVDDFKRNFKTKGFSTDDPLWEIAILKQVEDTLVCMRFHHSIVDGYSILYLRNLIFGKNMSVHSFSSDEDEDSQRVGAGYARKFYNLFRTPRQFIQLFLRSYSVKNSIQTSRPKDDVGYFSSTTLYYSDMKSIVRKTGVSFEALNFCLFASVLRRIIPNDIQGDYTYVGTVHPLPNHPTKSGKLGNHFTSAMYLLPIKEMDPIDRLMECHQNIKDFHESGLFSALSNTFSLTEYLPVTFIRKLTNTYEKILNLKLMCVTMLTFEESGHTLLGHPVIDEFQCTSRCSYNHAFAQASIIEEERCGITLVVPKHVVNGDQNKMEEIMGYYSEELNLILRSVENSDIKSYI